MRLKEVTLDTDTTVQTVYGQHMGARKGYNPKHRGKNSYQPILTFVAETREYVSRELRKGVTINGQQIAAHLDSVFSALPKGVERRYGRTTPAHRHRSQRDRRDIISIRAEMKKLVGLATREWPIVVLLALFAAIYSASLDSYGMFMWDEAEYSSLARSVLEGKGFSISNTPNVLRPPLLPLAGAVAMFMSGEKHRDLTLRRASFVLALLALLTIYVFSSAAFHRTVGLLSAGLLGISPFFWTFVPHFMCEILFMTFFSAAVWSFYLGTYRDESFFVWSSIFGALSYLTRYNGLLFVPIVLLTAAVAFWKGGPDVRRRLRSRTFLMSPLAAILIIAPWIVRQWIMFQHPLAGFKIAAQQLERDFPGLSMPWHFYLTRIPAMFSTGATLLLIPGLIWAFWKKDSFALLNITAATLILVCLSLYPYKEARYVSSAIPFLAVIASAGLAKVAACLRPDVRIAVMAGFLGTILFLNARTALPVFHYVVTTGYPSFLDAMAFLRTQADPESVVLGASVPQIYWYSGLTAIDFPEEKDLPNVLPRAAWVVITNFERAQKTYVSDLAHLALTEAPQDVQQFRRGQYETVVIRSDVLLHLLHRGRLLGNLHAN